MNLEAIKVDHVLPLLRGRFMTYAPNHACLDYAAMFATSRKRALELWNRRIAPELDIAAQRAFERALAKVNIRAGIAIPWTFSSGYAFGAACHAAAKGNPDQREDASVICGLYMFFMGTFDHLLDEHPDEFAELGTIISADALKQWVVNRDLRSLQCNPKHVLANGLLTLYRVYFRLCYRLLDRGTDGAIINTWFNALCDLHRVEAESVERRISKTAPSKELIQHAAAPSIAAFWGLAVSACLAEGEPAAKHIESFAKDYGRLTWYVDDASDIEKDIKADIWSGLAIRLSMGATNHEDIERIVLDSANEAGQIVSTLYAIVGSQRWETHDQFSLADLLWAYVWVWAGGQTQASGSGQSQPISAAS